ncbi:hypothetical protein CR513_32565, partial [Mucuna pruriens]
MAPELDGADLDTQIGLLIGLLHIAVGPVESVGPGRSWFGQDDSPVTTPIRKICHPVNEQP